MVRGWILEVEGKIAGFLGCIPLSYQWDGRSCLAMTPTAWDVLPEYRTYALRLFAEQMELAAGGILWDTTPTAQVRQVSLRLGFVPVPYECQNQYHVFRDRGGLLEWRLRSRGVDSWWPARLSRLERMAGRVVTPWRARQTTRHTVRVITHPDAVGQEFDRLWERTRSVRSHTRVRSAQWVRWYCFGSSGLRKLLVGCWLGESLVAFGIFREQIQRGKRPDALPARFLECLDLWHDPDHHDSVGAVLDHLLVNLDPWRVLGVTLYDFPACVPWLRGVRDTVRTPGTPDGLYLLPASMREAAQRETPCLFLAEGDVGL
ncbi:MAG: GNAT family N-acetyltransferase [Magnetococcales bacterium]|nr:GNAT family N-acetyltransferase [Magnetococcales bacterium]